MSSKTHSLGQGLDALFGNRPEELGIGNGERGSQTLTLDLIRPSSQQPRKHFDETELNELATSIQENGVLQPILVRPDPVNSGGYEIVAGERRWRAAQIAQCHEVPVVIRTLKDREALEISLIENIQRHDLSAIEEARGYRHLTEEFGETQDGIARQVGKSRSHVANAIRLLKLPERVQQWLEEGVLQAGHARALLAAKDPTGLAKMVIKQGLSVRQTEKLVNRLHVSKTRVQGKSADTRTLEAELSLVLGLKVTISGDAERGDVRIAYRNLSQLDRLIAKLRNQKSVSEASSF
ncbi:MAG: Chromosome-partitioning protein ParB [Alphaproteobacteria bacterium MarineAlpha9_Bin5]|nr:MAG: Chromosome-partitioning protein ParB [Alphaproteobacteria bacterium MarineAlpha9_Bin5]HIO01311.1 ParB/RepB/Spo0J family partition protein [Alphaproteobacteria bacterium]